MKGKALLSNASGELDQFNGLFLAAFNKATETCQQLLKTQPIDVLFYSNINSVIPETGIGGYAINQNLIQITIDPSCTIEKDEIFYTICHEIHHAKRYTGPGYGNSLYDSLVFEGLAICFEEEISDGKAFMVRYIKQQKDFEKIYDKLKPLLNDAEFNYHEIFITGNKNIPKWGGYIVGYNIVKKYIEKTGKKASSLVLAEASKIKI